MAEVIVGKDIRLYKPKDIGPFTLKQFGGILVGGICAYGVFAIEKALGLTLNEFTCFPIFLSAIPGVALGCLNKNGMSMTKYLKAVYIERVANPTKRPFGQDYVYPLELFAETDIVVESEETTEDNGKKKAKKNKKEKIDTSGYTKEELALLKKSKGYL